MAIGDPRRRSNFALHATPAIGPEMMFSCIWAIVNPSG